MTLILSIAGAIAVIGAVWIPLRNLGRLIAKTTRFIDEVVGEPAQFGRPAVPGAIQRMDNTEAAVKALAAAQVERDGKQAERDQQQVERDKLLQEIHHEMHPNSGLSMRDAVDRLEINNADAAALAREVKADLADHTEKVWDQLNEHNQAITTLAEAVKVAALSTPPVSKD